MRAEELKGNLDGMLLAVLSSGPLHGYAIIDALRKRSQGKVHLPSGTVYPALHRMEATGLVTSRWEVANGRRRRVYQITTAGERSLNDTRDNWRETIAIMRTVIFGELTGD